MKIRFTKKKAFLKDQFGVDFYEPDDQECIVEEFAIPLEELIPKLSYAESFGEAAIIAAKRLRVSSGLWVMAQYDFCYVPDTHGLDK